MTEQATSGTKADPLSSSTRNAKRNLLVASVVAITFKAFDITVEQIPVAGLAIRFDRGVFEFLLIVTISYLLVTFCLYYFIDIRNFPQTPHQLNTEQWRISKQVHFIECWHRAAVNAINSGPVTGCRASIDEGYRGELHRIAEAVPTLLAAVRYKPVSLCDASDLIFVHVDKSSPVVGQEKAEAKKLFLARLDEFTQRFPLHYAMYRLLLHPRTWTVRTAYFLRNYVIDGPLPIILALIALAALFHFLDVTSLTKIVPSSTASSIQIHG